MVHDISRGDVRSAARDNLFLLLLAPLLVLMLGRQSLMRVVARRSPQGLEGQYRALGAAALAWMLVRNTRAWPLKPPSAASPRR